MLLNLVIFSATKNKHMEYCYAYSWSWAPILFTAYTFSGGCVYGGRKTRPKLGAEREVRQPKRRRCNVMAAPQQSLLIVISGEPVGFYGQRMVG